MDQKSQNLKVLQGKVRKTLQGNGTVMNFLNRTVVALELSQQLTNGTS